MSHPRIHKPDLAFLPPPTHQEFLRSIPGGLLCCELHQEWLEALEDEDEEEEQVQDVKRCGKKIEKKEKKKIKQNWAALTFSTMTLT